jgi:hypothetical protein
MLDELRIALYRDHAIDFILIETFPLECCQSIQEDPSKQRKLVLYIDGLCMRILVQFKGKQAYYHLVVVTKVLMTHIQEHPFPSQITFLQK